MKSSSKMEKIQKQVPWQNSWKIEHGWGQILQGKRKTQIKFILGDFFDWGAPDEEKRYEDHRPPRFQDKQGSHQDDTKARMNVMLGLLFISSPEVFYVVVSEPIETSFSSTDFSSNVINAFFSTNFAIVTIFDANSYSNTLFCWQQTLFIPSTFIMEGPNAVFLIITDFSKLFGWTSCGGDCMIE